MKASPELRKRIEEAAEANGLSLTQEVERRLIKSFEDEERVGGREAQAFARAIGLVIPLIETQTGQKWQEDYRTWAAVKAAVERLALQWQPVRAEMPSEAKREELQDIRFEKMSEFHSLRQQRQDLYDSNPSLQGKDESKVAPELLDQVKTLNAKIRKLGREVDEAEAKLRELQDAIYTERNDAQLQGMVTAFEAIDALGFKDRMVMR